MSMKYLVALFMMALLNLNIVPFAVGVDLELLGGKRLTDINIDSMREDTVYISKQNGKSLSISGYKLNQFTDDSQKIILNKTGKTLELISEEKINSDKIRRNNELINGQRKPENLHEEITVKVYSLETTINTVINNTRAWEAILAKTRTYQEHLTLIQKRRNYKASNNKLIATGEIQLQELEMLYFEHPEMKSNETEKHVKDYKMRLEKLKVCHNWLTDCDDNLNNQMNAMADQFEKDTQFIQEMFHNMIMQNMAFHKQREEQQKQFQANMKSLQDDYNQQRRDRNQEEQTELLRNINWKLRDY